MVPPRTTRARQAFVGTLLAILLVGLVVGSFRGDEIDLSGGAIVVIIAAGAAIGSLVDALMAVLGIDLGWNTPPSPSIRPGHPVSRAALYQVLGGAVGLAVGLSSIAFG